MHTSEDPVACSGFSRRTFFRFAAGASALASMPILTEAAPGVGRSAPISPTPTSAFTSTPTRIPWAPREAARQAMIDIVPRGGRYLMDMEEDLASIFAKHGRPRSRVGDGVRRLQRAAALHRARHLPARASRSWSPIPAMKRPCGPRKIAGAEVIKVPLADPKGAASHDIKAMLAASSNPGVIYICNPNNPTGTCTPRAEIEYAVANAPKDTILLIDEAYIHLCDAPRSLDFVKEGKNVIVLRTFSKLYGMAGIRMGFAIGRPDLLKKISVHGGHERAAHHSAGRGQDQPARNRSGSDAQEDHRRHPRPNARLAQERGLRGHAIGEQLLHARRRAVPARKCRPPWRTKEMFVGRIWPAWPNSLRITVGTPDEMMAFRKAFTEVMARQQLDLDACTAATSDRGASVHALS